jgi:hypothetical protein
MARIPADRPSGAITQIERASRSKVFLKKVVAKVAKEQHRKRHGVCLLKTTCERRLSHIGRADRDEITSELD